jgi:hypothetical protein
MGQMTTVVHLSLCVACVRSEDASPVRDGRQQGGLTVTQTAGRIGGMSLDDAGTGDARSMLEAFSAPDLSRSTHPAISLGRRRPSSCCDRSSAPCRSTSRRAWLVSGRAPEQRAGTAPAGHAGVTRADAEARLLAWRDPAALAHLSPPLRTYRPRSIRRMLESCR